MAQTIIHIKNMVCPRCITAVKQTLSKLNIPYKEVELGQAILSTDSEKIDYELLNKELQLIGFELIEDKILKLIEKVKTLIVDYIHHFEGPDLKTNFSDYLKKETGIDYSYISKKFSETERITIEKYIILQKIEKVKELISYGELNFSEIAFKTNYSSVAHLSKQFKKMEGLTLSAYKKLDRKDRNNLDNV
ncbi:MAG: helix-turn-helix domain-containing protein [Bacteroidales bacterium]|nr:helix-turn-helix domain-containing protein [Bacteroidales bacterium]